MLFGVQIKAGDMINRHARTIIEKYGMSRIMDAFGHELPTVLQMHNYPNFLTKVDIPGPVVVCTNLREQQCPSVS